MDAFLLLFSVYTDYNTSLRKINTDFSKAAAAPSLFQRFFRFPLPWVMVVFPRWLMGLFRYLDFLSPLMEMRMPLTFLQKSFTIKLLLDSIKN